MAKLIHCPAKLLRNILRLSGVHVYSDSDGVVLTDGKFLGFVSTSAGLKHLMFPSPALVIQALDGRTIAQRVEVLDVEMQLGETRLYQLKTIRRE